MEFLDFPFEIREAILELVVHTNTTEPPNDAATLTQQLRKVAPRKDADISYDNPTLAAGEYTFMERDPRSGRGGTSWLPVFYRTATGKNPALPLLLVSRQIHDETKRILGGEVDHASWKADFMFIKNVGLWTTWLSASRFLGKVDTMHAQFRSFNAPETLDRAFFREDMWHGWPGVLPRGAWGLQHLIVGFLEGDIGPFPSIRHVDGPESHGDGRRGDTHGFTVGRLVIDCLSATEENILSLDQSTWRGTPNSVLFASEARLDPALPDQKRAALALADFLLDMLRLLLRPTPYAVNESKEVFERVGEILVQVDGERHGHIDVSEILAGLSWQPYSTDSDRSARINRARQWMREAMEMRRRAGLKTFPMPS